MLKVLDKLRHPTSEDGEMNFIPSADTVLQQAEEIKIGAPWFKVLRLPNDVFSIHEPGHQQGVISFLIAGSQKSILFDTGMGIRDISSIVDQLTDLEVMVVNSHTHFDHIGDDHRFSNIFVYDHDIAIQRLTTGWSNEELQFDVSLDAFIAGYPERFDPQNYAIKPVGRDKITLLHENDVIDLGNRTLQVLHTPGHSPDSIMLLDRLNRCLFTGDTIYPDWLFAFISEEWGGSDPKVYAKTIRELTHLVPELDYLYGSHSKPLADPPILHDVAKAFEMIIDGDDIAYEPIEIYGQELRIYYFDGFAIVMKNE